MNDLLLRQIPKVDDCLRDEAWQKLSAYPESVAKDYLREVLADLRTAIREDKVKTVPSIAEVVEETEKRTRSFLSPTLRRVINATGVVIHTNLGRSPLPPSAIERLTATASGYSNLEYDLKEGARGDRHDHCLAALSRLTGAEGAIIVNNNAAAVLLVLNTLAEGREVVIGRGELIEIGGSFRIPEVMKKSGAILREVGTTNRTFVEDYEQAIGETTGLIMKAHTSNYRIRGFVHETGSEELAALAEKHGVPFFFDAGSGLISPLGEFARSEPSILDEMKKGIGLISFSGDKLLGGPQAGIIVGRKSLVDALKRNPLTRALRPDKFTLAALEATLLLYLDPRKARQTVPVLRMLDAREDLLKKRANRVGRGLLKATAGLKVDVVKLSSEVGGGSLPDILMASYGLSLSPERASVERFEQRMRELDTPIIGRIEKGRFLIDMRTVLEEEEQELISGVVAALGSDTARDGE